MKAKKTIAELQKAGWTVDVAGEQKQHYQCTGTGHMGSRAKAVAYKATQPGCAYRLEFFVSLATSIDEEDSHDDIQILHKSEPSNASGCMRRRTVKAAINEAMSFSLLVSEKKVKPSMDALFDGSNAHRLIGDQQREQA